MVWFEALGGLKVGTAGLFRWQYSFKVIGSSPSSHTMLVILIMGTAITQFQKRINSMLIKRLVVTFCFIVIIITVIGRLVSSKINKG